MRTTVRVCDADNACSGLTVPAVKAIVIAGDPAHDHRQQFTVGNGHNNGVRYQTVQCLSLPTIILTVVDGTSHQRLCYAPL